MARRRKRVASRASYGTITVGGYRRADGAVVKGYTYHRGMSQSRMQVATRGLMWGGRNFKGKAAFGNWLRAHGQSVSRWQRIHKQAAKGLVP